MDKNIIRGDKGVGSSPAPSIVIEPPLRETLQRLDRKIKELDNKIAFRVGYFDALGIFNKKSDLLLIERRQLDEARKQVRCRRKDYHRNGRRGFQIGDKTNK